MIDAVKEIMEQISKEIASDIDYEIFICLWYLHFPEGSDGYKLMAEYNDARDKMKEANPPNIDAQRMEYINSMDDVSSEYFSGAEIRALETYFAACDRYNEARKRYVQFFKEAHDKMADSDKIIELIRRNGDFQYNEKDMSYYKKYETPKNETMEVRVSDHGTDLSTWYDGGHDPSTTTNICIVFSYDGIDIINKDKCNETTSEQKPFEIIQYVYNCELLDKLDVAYINQAIHFIWGTKQFNDPMVGTPKEAKVVKLN